MKPTPAPKPPKPSFWTQLVNSIGNALGEAFSNR